MLMKRKADRSEGLFIGFGCTFVFMWCNSLFARFYGEYASEIIYPGPTIFVWAVIFGTLFLVGFGACRFYSRALGPVLSVVAFSFTVMGLSIFFEHLGFPMLGDSHFVAMQASVNASIGHLMGT